MVTSHLVGMRNLGKAMPIPDPSSLGPRGREAQEEILKLALDEKRRNLALAGKASLHPSTHPLLSSPLTPFSSSQSTLLSSPLPYMSCHAMPYYAILCHAGPRYAMLRGR